MGSCLYCGNETNPKKYWGGKTYKITPKYCSMICKGKHEDAINKASRYKE